MSPKLELIVFPTILPRNFHGKWRKIQDLASAGKCEEDMHSPFGFEHFRFDNFKKKQKLRKWRTQRRGRKRENKDTHLVVVKVKCGLLVKKEGFRIYTPLVSSPSPSFFAYCSAEKLRCYYL